MVQGSVNIRKGPLLQAENPKLSNKRAFKYGLDLKELLNMGIVV